MRADLRGTTVDVSGPQNLTFDEVVAVVRQVTGADGPVAHVPRAMLRVLSLALRPIKPVLAGQIAAALVMDTRDMTADPTERVGRFSGIPSTGLLEVATRQLGGIAAGPSLPGRSPAPR